MSNKLFHEGFFGEVNFSAEDNVFHGKITGITDLVSFEGTTVEELKNAFKEAVEDYIETCEKLGKEVIRFCRCGVRLNVHHPTICGEQITIVSTTEQSIIFPPLAAPSTDTSEPIAQTEGKVKRYYALSAKEPVFLNGRGKDLRRIYNVLYEAGEQKEIIEIVGCFLSEAYEVFEKVTGKPVPQIIRVWSEALPQEVSAQSVEADKTAEQILRQSFDKHIAKWGVEFDEQDYQWVLEAMEAYKAQTK